MNPRLNLRVMFLINGHGTNGPLVVNPPDAFFTVPYPANRNADAKIWNRAN